MSYGNSGLGQGAAPQRTEAPIREGGLQMRLTETFKMLCDAHFSFDRIEIAFGRDTPDITADNGKAPGPMNIEQLTMQVRDMTAGICERLQRIEGRL